MDLAMNPHYACEVTLQPVERYPLDAAILFSDILTIPDAMGLGLSFQAGEGRSLKRQSEMKKQSILYSFRILVANSNMLRMQSLKSRKH